MDDIICNTCGHEAGSHIGKSGSCRACPTAGRPCYEVLDGIIESHNQQSTPDDYRDLLNLANIGHISMTGTNPSLGSLVRWVPGQSWAGFVDEFVDGAVLDLIETPEFGPEDTRTARIISAELSWMNGIWYFGNRPIERLFLTDYRAALLRLPADD